MYLYLYRRTSGLVGMMMGMVPFFHITLVPLSVCLSVCLSLSLSLSLCVVCVCKHSQHNQT